MRNRILLILLVIAGVVGVIAVVWFILRPALPSILSPQPPASTQQPSEKPFNPTPNLPQPTTSSGTVDSASPSERERQAQEALKRTAIDIAARINTYSNADDFEALRSIQSVVDPAFATTLETRRQTLRRDHPAFGNSWGISTNALSATLNSPPPIFTATQASVSVQAQQVVESAGRPNEVKQVRVDLTFKKNGTSWMVSDQSIQDIL
jgi:hypothetical protein